MKRPATTRTHSVQDWLDQKRLLSQQDLGILGVRPGLVATRYTPGTEEDLEERGAA